MKLGYTIIYVNDVAITMDFYEKAFGLKRAFIHETQYGEMMTGDTKLGFAHHSVAQSHGFSYQKLSPEQDPPGVEIGFITEDVQAAYTRAISAGATSASKPTQKPWGQIVSYVRDCNGLLIEICSAL